MRLFEEKQKDLDAYLEKLKGIESQIIQDIYNRGSSVQRTKAENLKRDILKDFSYSAVKNHLR